MHFWPKNDSLIRLQKENSLQKYLIFASMVLLKQMCSCVDWKQAISSHIHVQREITHMFGQEVLDLRELEIRSQFYLGKSKSQNSSIR